MMSQVVKSHAQQGLEPRASGVPCQCSTHWAIETQYFDWLSHTWIPGDNETYLFIFCCRDRYTKEDENTVHRTKIDMLTAVKLVQQGSKGNQLCRQKCVHFLLLDFLFVFYLSTDVIDWGFFVSDLQHRCNQLIFLFLTYSIQM